MLYWRGFNFVFVVVEIGSFYIVMDFCEKGKLLKFYIFIKLFGIFYVYIIYISILYVVVLFYFRWFVW